VDSGNSGDIKASVVALFAASALDSVILRRWETIATDRATDRDCPDKQRHPIRTPPGDRPPAMQVLKSPANVAPT
jgi:hypothetical protein